MNIGWQEILLILLIALLLFGAKKIPDLARGLGKGIREFRKGLSYWTDGWRLSLSLAMVPAWWPIYLWRKIK